VNGIRLTFDVHGSGSDPVLLAGPIGAPGGFWVPFLRPPLSGEARAAASAEAKAAPPRPRSDATRRRSLRRRHPVAVEAVRHAMRQDHPPDRPTRGAAR